MAKLHNKVEAEELLTAIDSFLSSCRSPAVIEDGDTPIALLPGSYELQLRSGRLCLEASTEARMLSRRIKAIERAKPGILDCTVQRFGGAEARLSFLDLDRPQTTHRQLRASRMNFGEQFRRMLRRQFPQWEITALSSSMDLRRSFSPVFPRATLTRGQQVIVAIACPAAANEAELLTFALLWFHHVAVDSATLCLFLPAGSGCLTAHRLRWLRNDLLRARLFLYNEHGSAGEVDGQDLGNLDTRVSSQYVQAPVSPAMTRFLDQLADLPHASAIRELSGAMSLRMRGAEYARVEEGRIRLGLAGEGEARETDLAEVQSFAVQLAELASGPSSPERWLEGAVRADLQSIDVDLQETPVHGQVLTFAGQDRDAVDLLAVDRGGNLTVLELKASEDLHLPMQALDYWMRIKWHSERQELVHLFPGMNLSGRAPKLYLVAPALSFHPSTATVLRYFSPEVEVERIGANSGWQTRFRVVLRLSGANPPISHGRS